MKYILPINKIDKEDTLDVGGIAVTLGEATRIGVTFPPAFVVKTNAFRDYLMETKLGEKIQGLLEDLGTGNSKKLDEAKVLVKKAMNQSAIPSPIAKEIVQACRQMGRGKSTGVSVQVSPNERFFENAVLGKHGANNVVEMVRDVWANESASLLGSVRSNLFKYGIAVVVKQEIRAECSGIAFSIEPVSGDKTKIIVEAVYGLGEILKSGSVTPDHFEFNKANLEMLYSHVGLQDRQMVAVDRNTRSIAVSKAYMGKQKIGDKAAREIANYTRLLESYLASPVEVEWVWDGRKTYVVGLKAVITTAFKPVLGQYINLPKILKGAPGSPGIGSGRAVVVHQVKDLVKVQRGDVLVTELTGSELKEVMKRAAAVVTDLGGRTSPVSIVSREFGVPAVVGSLSATKELLTGQLYTVNGTSGDVYSGVLRIKTSDLPYEEKQVVTVPTSPVKTATKVMASLLNYQDAVKLAGDNIEGAEIFGSSLIAEIGQHPRKAINEHKRREFIEELVEKIAVVSKSFGERQVIYRSMDLKSNQLRELLGGEKFEEFEKNPNLGLRGASRYLRDPEAFELELEALKKVRNVIGSRNLSLAIPFVRTPEELSSVKQLVTAAGLHRSASFKLFIMAQIPTNVIRLEDFSKVGIDGIIVDGNELAQMILGKDQFLVDEKPDESVEWCFEKISRDGRKMGLVVGFSGTQTATLIDKLVSWGYSFVTVNNCIDETRNQIAGAERELVIKQ
jgi:pyruvate, water dikinase